MPERTRVLVVDDHQVIAEGLAMLVGHSADLQVVGVAHSATEGLQRAIETRPDVVLLDQRLPDRPGTDIIVELKGHLPDTAVIVLTSEESDEVLVDAFEAGASGYLLKTRAASEVIDAIRSAAGGEMLVSEGTLARLLRIQRVVTRQRTKTTDALTDREREVLQCVAAGLETRAIADRLGLTVSTVRTYVQVILRKLDAHSRLQAVLRAREQGLI